MVSIRAAQTLLPVDVRYKFTEPAAVSALLGIYVVINVVALGEKIPVPLLDHIPPVALVTVPVSDTFGLLPQTV